MAKRPEDPDAIRQPAHASRRSGSHPERGPEELASRDRFPGCRRGRVVPTRHSSRSSSPIRTHRVPLDAAVDRLVHPPLVLEERSPSLADAHQGEREIEPHRGPSAVQLEGAAEGRHRLGRTHRAGAGTSRPARGGRSPRRTAVPFVDHFSGEAVRPRRRRPSAGTRWRVLPSPTARWVELERADVGVPRRRQSARAEVLSAQPRAGARRARRDAPRAVDPAPPARPRSRPPRTELLHAAQPCRDRTLRHPTLPPARAARSRRSSRCPSCCSSKRSSISPEHLAQSFDLFVVVGGGDLDRNPTSSIGTSG